MGKPSSLDTWGIFGFSSRLGHIFLAAGADGGLEQSGGEYFQDRYGCFSNWQMAWVTVVSGRYWKILEGCRYITRWWFQIFFIFTPILGEIIQFDQHIFSNGWFNHQLDILCTICYFESCVQKGGTSLCFLFLISTPQPVLGSTYLIMRQRWQLRSFAQWNITTSPEKNKKNNNMEPKKCRFGSDESPFSKGSSIISGFQPF